MAGRPTSFAPGDRAAGKLQPTPLPRKLGLKDGHRLLLLGAPEGFEATLGPLPMGVEVKASLRGTKPFDVVLLFTDRQRRLQDMFPRAQARLTTAGGLWVCWPKKASKVPTDLDDGVVRAYGLSTGLVDNKVCAVDAVWSGLRFVRRRADR